MENALKNCKVYRARDGGCRYYNDNMGLTVGDKGGEITSMVESSWWKRLPFLAMSFTYLFSSTMTATANSVDIASGSQ